MLTLAVLGQLRAHGNWHRIAREWIYGDQPVTELGRARGGVLRARARRERRGCGCAALAARGVLARSSWRSSR